MKKNNINKGWWFLIIILFAFSDMKEWIKSYWLLISNIIMWYIVIPIIGIYLNYKWYAVLAYYIIISFIILLYGFLKIMSFCSREEERRDYE